MNFGDWTIDIPRPTWAVWFGDTWRMNNSVHRQLRRALGRGFRRARSAARHHAGHLRSARRQRVRRHRHHGRRSALSGRPARHQQRRPARRLHLERRRHGQARHPRRQRPLLQHPRLEHDLQPAVVQRRADPRQLVPERRPAGLHPESDARAHGRRTSSAAASRCRRSRRGSSPTTTRCRTRGRASSGSRRSSAPGLGFEADFTLLEGLQLRQPARSEPVLQSARPATTSTRHRAGRIRSSARSSGSSRTAAPTTPRSRRRSTGASATTGRRASPTR